jgi:hypothetical protein
MTAITERRSQSLTCSGLSSGSGPLGYLNDCARITGYSEDSELLPVSAVDLEKPIPLQFGLNEAMEFVGTRLANLK